MPSYKSAFGSFLKTEDLQGKAVRLVIESVALESIDDGEGGKEEKLVARFHKAGKGLVLNRTNCEAIEALAGHDDYARWAGVGIVLFPTTTKFGNNTVGCMRIRGQNVVAPPPPPPPASPTSDAELDDPIPF